MKLWKRIEPTTVQQCGRRTIVSKTFELPGDRIQQFDIKEREGWGGVATVALTTEGRALVLRQFRPGVEQIMDELPGGMVEEDEVQETDGAIDIAALTEVAARELREETGHTGNMRYLGKLTYDAYTNGWRYAFLATDCLPVEGGQALDANEQGAELLEISVEELIQIALQGRMTDPGAVLLACAAEGWTLPPLEP